MKSKKNIPQGLKPNHFMALIGTTEVMPCYKARFDLVFRSLYNPSSPRKVIGGDSWILLCLCPLALSRSFYSS